MKGHFSIEWLSQSSQTPASPRTAAVYHQHQHPSSWISAASSERASTSGTVPESLPGFYSRRADNTEAQEPQEAQETRPEQNGPAHGFLNPSQQQETGMSNTENVQLAPELGFSSGTEEEETSGYESEGGRSLSPMASKQPAPSVSPTTGRRARTAFTAEQIESLERAFKRNAYLGAQDKAELCKRLSLSDKQIRNWFQNRRMKLKRTVQDALAHACQANVASQLIHYPELQTFRPAPYPSYYPPQEAAASYLCPPSLHYSPAAATAAVTAVQALPVNPLYQYRSPQSLPVAPGNPALRGTYPPYPPQYFSSQ
ncbi:homeobox protein vex1-like [Astyanax mexicanus]|uniref:Homeobox protein vex1-like n=1 Tax=Astyanax mexicanus TaxID=7994 RepID=A0A8T2KUP5_ASTMX|nr:homeobox protein vex1-like [Astyanax mexicanus]